MTFQRAHTANTEMDAEGQPGAPSSGPCAIPASSQELNAVQDDFRLSKVINVEGKGTIF